MESTIYVVDATTLINGIHELKQWVYDGLISIHIPTCTSTEVETAYKSSIAPKEPVKETGHKKLSGRTARRDQPLFDINPRTVREFLTRAHSDNGEKRVSLQQDSEEFTQWSKEEKAAVPDEPSTPPSSFADALLRKLNIKDPAASAGAKGPSKPRLVARSSESKSPWRNHKIPSISIAEVPEYAKSLFSCVLWRLYEFEKNPLRPENFVLLSDFPDIRYAADRLRIPSMTLSMLRSTIQKKRNMENDPATRGQLEADFLVAKVEATSDDQSDPPGGNSLSEKYKGELNMSDVLVEGFLEDDDMLEELKKHASSPNDPAKPEPSTTKAPDVKPSELLGSKAVNGASDREEDGSAEIAEGTAPAEEKVAAPGEVDDIPNKGTYEKKPTGAEPINTQKRSSPRLGSPVSGLRKIESDSDVGSDEEIIVFNPRARKVGGGSQKSFNSPRSRPPTAHGLTPQPLQSLSGPQGETMNEQPAGLGSPSPPSPSKLRPRSQIESTLKPQSPVFTPGQLYVPSQPQLQTKQSPGVFQASSASDAAGNPASPRGEAESAEASHSKHQRSPSLPNYPRAIAQRRPRSSAQPQASGQDAYQVQRQSEIIIQRQREAIQRQVKTTPKAPLRQIQMEPTENPTVIDPDAFDRSYVVQPRSTPQNSQGHKRRSGGGWRRGSPRNSPNRSPKQSEGAGDADIEFVLKSGAPRGSTRGKGKLWIP